MNKGKNLNSLRKMAKDYGVEKNAMVKAHLELYAFQLDTIENMKQELAETDGLMTSKEYVKGRENVYVHPILKELPKHTDAANKTAQTIMNLIETYGIPPKAKSKLEELIGS